MWKLRTFVLVWPALLASNILFNYWFGFARNDLEEVENAMLESTWSTLEHFPSTITGNQEVLNGTHAPDRVEEPIELTPFAVKVLEPMRVGSHKNQTPRLLKSFPELDEIKCFPLLEVEDGTALGMKQPVLDRSFWDDKQMPASKWRTDLGFIAGRTMLSAQVASVLSHRRALEHFLDRDKKEWALVLQQEATLDARMENQDLIKSVTKIVQSAPDGWQLINLGRCESLCEQSDASQAIDVELGSVGGNKPAMSLSILPSKGWEFCSRSYLISRSGAELMLQYTAPALLPLEHLRLVLARSGLLKLYSTSPPLFADNLVHLPITSRMKNVGPKDECVPVSPSKVAALAADVDKSVVNYIRSHEVQDFVSIESRKLKETGSVMEAESARLRIVQQLCDQGRRQYCMQPGQMVQASKMHCKFLGGSANRPGQKIQTDPVSMRFLQLMDSRQLDGVIIWGLLPFRSDHSHSYLHDAIFRNFQYALAQSQRRRHLCFLEETPHLNLGRFLYDDPTKHKTANSLIFASPRQMQHSMDPPMFMLPVEDSSLYVFHGSTPNTHQTLRRMGNAIEWETWGKDGHHPWIDSEEFSRGRVWDPNAMEMEGCNVDRNKKMIQCKRDRRIAMPWASLFTYQEIMQKRREAIRKDLTFDNNVRFVGSLWSCNLDTFADFSQGCRDVGINVTRYGKWIQARGNKGVTSKVLSVINSVKSDEPFDVLLKDSVYAPAIQGDCHLSPDSASYIADRLINVISLGLFPLTNNRDAFELLGSSNAILFHHDVKQLCQKMKEHRPNMSSMVPLMNDVAENHTYISRFVTLLEFAQELHPTVG